LIGMGSRVLNGAHIGAGSLIAAGAVVAQGVEVPPGSLVAGVPGKVRREMSADDLAANRANAQTYVERSAAYRIALSDTYSTRTSAIEERRDGNVGGVVSCHLDGIDGFGHDVGQ